MKHSINNSDKQGLMIVAPNSGSGKTVITLALLRAFKDYGVNVSSAKTGPDFIDPQFHAIASGRQSFNLDPWAMDDTQLKRLVDKTEGSHLLVEGMMGLFDGAADGSASSAELATRLGLNVVLVVNCAKQSHSIAALVSGFRDYSQDIKLVGVILNQVGSPRHEIMLRDALRKIDANVLGVIPRAEQLQVPERHLGLVPIGEMENIEPFICDVAKIVKDNCDFEALLDCFGVIDSNSKSKNPTIQIKPIGQKIAIAKDIAFSFIYPHLLDNWREQGATITEFSPLADEGPPLDADAVYLPGGYPELHARRLSEASNFRNNMEAARLRDALIYGECGGYMVLGNGIVDKNGKRHKMLGFLDLETSFQKRTLNLGYRMLECPHDLLGGTNWRGHEFHYSTIVKEVGKPLFEVRDALGVSLGNKGLQRDNVMGSYMHLVSVRK